MLGDNDTPRAAVRPRIVWLLFFGAAMLASCSSMLIPPGITISPSSSNVPVGQKQTFAISGSGNEAITWAVNGMAGGNSTVGTITAAGPNGTDGIYSAPTSIPNPAAVTITATTGSSTQPLATATAAIGPFITIAPLLPIVETYSTQQFTVTVTGTSNTAVSWHVSCSAGGSLCGAISQAGLYHAPNSVPTATVSQTGGTFRVTEAASVTAAWQANPAFAVSVPVDIASLNQRALMTPVQLGVSGSNLNDFCTANGVESCNAGTLGSLVTRAGNLYILSSSHVLASAGTPIAGNPIVQPGLLDAECGIDPTTTIANLTEFTDPVNTASRVDASLAQVVGGTVDPTGAILELGSTVSNGIPQPEPPAQGAGQAAMVNEAVAKSGRSTGLTCASVESVDVSMSVGEPGPHCSGSQVFVTFPDVIVVNGTGFSAGGDSGSLIVDANTAEPIALLFAANAADLTIANPISDVLSALKDASGNAPTFVGGAEHAVAACSLAEPSAKAVRAAHAQEMTVPRSDVENAYAAAQRSAGLLFESLSVRAVGVGASLDAPGTPAIIVFVQGNESPGLPLSLSGFRTRIVRLRSTLGRTGLIDAAETSRLLSESELQASAVLQVKEMARAVDVKEKYTADAMADPVVQGIGISASLDNPGDAALIFYVLRGKAHRPIPPSIEGVRTRFRETSPFRARTASAGMAQGCFARPH